MTDPIDHPSHYTFGRLEVIDVIEDWKLGFHLGNAVKYIARAGKKGDAREDLAKARWYLDRAITAEGQPAAEPARVAPPRKAAALPAPTTNRMARIAERATARTPPPIKGKRRAYTPEFKLSVLQAIDGGRTHKDVTAEHSLSSSLIHYWRKQAAAGTLVPLEGGGNDGPIAGLDNDVLISSGDEDEGDLVDGMAGPEEGAAEDPGPFDQDDAMLAGRRPSSPRRGSPRMFPRP